METYTEKHTNEQNKKNKTPNDQGIESGILKACPLHQSRLAGIRGGSVELSKDKEALSLPFRHCFRGWKRGEAPQLLSRCNVSTRTRAHSKVLH